MVQPLQPDHPSQEDYIILSEEFKRKGLIFERYRQLLWYQGHYGTIEEDILSPQTAENEPPGRDRSE